MSVGCLGAIGTASYANRPFLPGYVATNISPKGLKLLCGFCIMRLYGGAQKGPA